MHKFRIYKDMIDIDYYVYFSKAYFAYNAYLKAKYSSLTDIDKNKKMNAICKSNENTYLGKTTQQFFIEDYEIVENTLSEINSWL